MIRARKFGISMAGWMLAGLASTIAIADAESDDYENDQKNA